MERITQIQQEIKETLHEVKNLLKLENHIKDLNNQLAEALSIQKKVEYTIDKELEDIEKLEGGSVKSLFHNILGSKEEQLEKERQDYLEASLKLKEINNRIKIIEYEKSLISNKTVKLKELNIKLEKLKSLRKNEILKGNDEIKNQLITLIEDIDYCVILNKEIGEASIEGSKSIKILNVVLSYLKQANDWGTWQQNNRRSQIQKNRSIDYAINNLSKAQVQLDTFLKELRDLGTNQVSLELSKIQFNQFTDFFFDNLISDWIIQQRIKNTMNNVESVLSKVQRIVLSLNEEEKINKEKLKKLIQTQNDLLLI